MAFGFYKSVTIDHTQCGSTDASDFPVAIYVTDADLKTVANGGKVQNSNGYDIRPYSDSGLTIALTYELAEGVYTATTGKLEMHVKIPTVSHTSDTLFYLAFGDSGISSDGSSTATWSNNFGAVWHLCDVTTLGLSDSTSYGHQLSQLSSDVSGTTGVLNGGTAHNGASAAYLSASTDANVEPTAALCVSGWMNPVSATGDNPILAKGSAFNDSGGLNLFGQSNGNVYFDMKINGSFSRVTGTGSNATGWHLFHGTYDGSTQTLYKDGAYVNSVSVSGSQGWGPAVEWRVGSYPGFANLSGSLDECRIVNVNRSVDWVLTEYNNQVTGSTFLTWGALTPVGGGATPTTRLPLLGVG